LKIGDWNAAHTMGSSGHLNAFLPALISASLLFCDGNSEWRVKTIDESTNGSRSFARREHMLISKTRAQFERAFR